MSVTLSPAVGSFTAEAFAAHLASLGDAPAWWLDRKRAAYETFASLPLPTRTNEGWRFSTLTGLTLSGFEVAAPAPLDIGHCSLDIPRSAELVFANNRLQGGTQFSEDLKQRGVFVTTLSAALRSHPALIR
jgi:Fe-S cluster assembly protein SufD